ncbi:hypothetical protein [Ruegeria atlantica]|uniref:hypothetical protein n=1 Tax=Ruegeria atlantica TaxID=81569 RepID=UPI00148127E8|nr:hypothetical protein [Ruegeria atlantica]
MKRSWITFESSKNDTHPFGVEDGAGATALSNERALSTIQEQLFDGDNLSTIGKILENVGVSKLDANHIRRDVGGPVSPGIWYPLGYQ